MRAWERKGRRHRRVSGCEQVVWTELNGRGVRATYQRLSRQLQHRRHPTQPGRLLRTLWVIVRPAACLLVLPPHLQVIRQPNARARPAREPRREHHAPGLCRAEGVGAAAARGLREQAEAGGWFLSMEADDKGSKEASLSSLSHSGGPAPHSTCRLGCLARSVRPSARPRAGPRECALHRALGPDPRSRPPPPSRVGTSPSGSSPLPCPSDLAGMCQAPQACVTRQLHLVRALCSGVPSLPLGPRARRGRRQKPRQRRAVGTEPGSPSSREGGNRNRHSRAKESRGARISGPQRERKSTESVVTHATTRG